MIKYKMVQAANGRTMYYKNGRMVGVGTIPKGIVSALEPGVTLETSSPAPVQPQETANFFPGTAPELTPETVDETLEDQSKSKQNEPCIFCGEPSERSKFINQQIARLCEADYQNNTTGEIVAQLRKNESEQQ